MTRAFGRAGVGVAQGRQRPRLRAALQGAGTGFHPEERLPAQPDLHYLQFHTRRLRRPGSGCRTCFAAGRRGFSADADLSFRLNNLIRTQMSVAIRSGICGPLCIANCMQGIHG